MIPTLAEGLDFWDALIRQSPAAAAVVLVVVFFLRYLTQMNGRQETAHAARMAADQRAEETRAAREERLENLRTEAIKEMAASCHENHKALAAEGNAAIAGLSRVLEDNSKALGASAETHRIVAEALRDVTRKNTSRETREHTRG